MIDCNYRNWTQTHLECLLLTLLLRRSPPNELAFIWYPSRVSLLASFKSLTSLSLWSRSRSWLALIALFAGDPRKWLPILLLISNVDSEILGTQILDSITINYVGLPVRDAGLEFDGVWMVEVAALLCFLFSSIFRRSSSTLRSRSSWLGYKYSCTSFNY